MRITAFNFFAEMIAWMKVILMGQNDRNRTTFGLLDSNDGRHWTLLPE